MEKLEDFISELKNSSKLIIVEGKKDKKALGDLGIKNIITLKQPIYKIVEQISKKNKEVIILTDLDKEGKKLYGKLNSELQRFGVNVDKKFREFLFKKTTLRQIEGLSSYVENQKNLKREK